MTGFHGYFLLVLFFFFVVPSMSTRQIERNPQVELSSREQFVEMAGYGEERLSSVLVTGSVFCEACFHGEAAFRALPVSGATVAVDCKMRSHDRKRGIKVTRAQGKTDEYGDFIIDLPSHLHALPYLDKSCSVRVLPLPKTSPCSTTTRRALNMGKHTSSSGITLSSVGNSIRTYTAGDIKFHQQLYKRPLMCHVNKQRDIQ